MSSTKKASQKLAAVPAVCQAGKIVMLCHVRDLRFRAPPFSHIEHTHDCREAPVQHGLPSAQDRLELLAAEARLLPYPVTVRDSASQGLTSCLPVSWGKQQAGVDP